MRWVSPSVASPGAGLGGRTSESSCWSSDSWRCGPARWCRWAAAHRSTSDSSAPRPELLKRRQRHLGSRLPSRSCRKLLSYLRMLKRIRAFMHRNSSWEICSSTNSCDRCLIRMQCSYMVERCIRCLRESEDHGGQTQNTENTKSWEAKAKSLYTLDFCTNGEKTDVRGQNQIHWCHKGGGSRRLSLQWIGRFLGDLGDETPEKPNSLFPRKEFLFDCLWISIVMLAPFASNIIMFDQIFPLLHPELFQQSQRTKFDTSQQGATEMPLIPSRPVQGIAIITSKPASK